MAIETRRRLPYKGLPRFKPARRTGKLEPVRQRAFAPPHDYALRWSVLDQVVAIDRGYFLERSDEDNHVIIAPIADRFATDQAVVDWLEQDAFRGDAHSLKALRFIAQQDRFGWSGTWELKATEHVSSNMRWYKDHKARERGQGPEMERVLYSATNTWYWRRKARQPAAD